MAKIIGTNIISSLGFTTKENFFAVKSGISGIKHYDVGTFGLPEAFMASLIDKERLNDCFADICRDHVLVATDLTLLEKASILSVFIANQEANVDLSNSRTLFILSTTKGNVDLLSNSNFPENVYLWKTAKTISRFFDNKNTPLVVSNACISGAAAQIAAMRELQLERYDHAIVTGVDFLSKFIVSGFQSFKALSPEICRPHDALHKGLNLGEAAATIIYSKNENAGSSSLIAGAIRNDANHISGPSRTGEGSFRALQCVLQDIAHEDIAFINTHGTATPYNDAMEAVAITRAGLQDVPANSLKAHFGHTLGAAGILESIVSMQALEENTVLKSLNFERQDTENQINIANKKYTSNKKYFVKMLSGFGGCNAALLFERDSKIQNQNELS